MNTVYRQSLPGTSLDYFDARAAVEAIQPGAYDTLPYTSRVLAENLVRRCDPAILAESLKQIIERKRERDFPWFPARVVCHDIPGQVDQGGLAEDVMAHHARREPGEVAFALALDQLLQRIGQDRRIAAAHQVLGQHARGVRQRVVGARLDRLHGGARIEVIQRRAGKGLAVGGIHKYREPWRETPGAHAGRRPLVPLQNRHIVATESLLLK